MGRHWRSPRPAEVYGLPTYVWATLVLGLFVLLRMSACSSAPQPAWSHHYGWSQPHIGMEGDPPPGAPRAI
jgi:hypothetical protein